MEKCRASIIPLTCMLICCGPSEETVTQSIHTGPMALIGDPGYDPPRARDNGAVVVYGLTDSHWRMTARLTGPPTPGALLGTSAVFDGNEIIAGAPGANKVLIFRRFGSHWRVVQVIAKTVMGQSFGASVAVLQDSLWIGAPGSQRGAVYLYWRREPLYPWMEGGQIDGDGPEFGSSVSLPYQ